MKQENRIQITYYIVLVTRYKRPRFKDRRTLNLILDGFREVQNEGILNLINYIENESYLYLQCNCTPEKSPNQIVTALKRASFQRLLQEKGS